MPLQIAPEIVELLRETKDVIDELPGEFLRTEIILKKAKISCPLIFPIKKWGELSAKINLALERRK